MKKRSVGRPRLKDPKSYVNSIRLSEADMKKIKKHYGTFKKMIEGILKTLPILLLVVSCGGPGGGAAGAAVEETLAPVSIIGNLYAISVNIQKPYSLGYDLSYSCSNDTCSVTGELHHWNIAGTFVTKAQISTGNLAKAGSNYVGIFYMTNGQQFNVSVNIDQNFIKMDNGVNCTRRQETTTQSGYDAYLGSVANADGVIAFNSLVIGQCEL
jgi:hypothetical protein